MAKNIAVISAAVALIITWSGHDDAFADVWPQAVAFLENNTSIEAKTLFEHLRTLYPRKVQKSVTLEILTCQRQPEFLIKAVACTRCFL